jgi:hypothetical protein
MWSLFSTRRQQPARPRRVSSKPRLEILEDRCTPSGFAASAAAPDLSGHPLGSGLGVGTDAAGNVYTAGYVGGTLHFNDTDGYVVKRAADGKFMWSQVVQGLDSAGNSFADSADVIAVDAAGNSYVAGNFSATLTLGNFSITATSPFDAFVEKLDTNGNVLWLHQFARNEGAGPPTFERLGTLAPKGIAVDPAGNVVVTGSFLGHIDLDPVAHPGQHFLDTPNGIGESYVVKLNASGDFVWQAQSASGSFSIALDA